MSATWIGLGISAYGAVSQNRSAKKAVGAQTDASDEALAQGDQGQLRLEAALRPYTQGGNQALTGMLDMLGIGASGQQGQQQAITDIENSPQFQSMTQQGEEAILANASATGNLRGGNTQGALAQFRPQVLNQLLQQKFNRLSGISQIGQASAAQVGAGAINTGTNAGSILQNRGEAIGQGYIAQGNTFSNFAGDVSGALSRYAGNRSVAPAPAGPTYPEFSMEF